jgi:hypothetical protein
MSQFYPKYKLPRDFGADESDPIYQQAQEQCKTWLKPMLESWGTLRQVIKECSEYPMKGYPADLFNAQPCPDTCPDEGYPVRIHSDPTYQALWLELESEGYLISRPTPPSHDQNGNRPQRRRKARKQIAEASRFRIPPDPRVLEPFVMRVHYFSSTLNVEPELKDLYLTAQPPSTTAALS